MLSHNWNDSSASACLFAFSTASGESSCIGTSGLSSAESLSSSIIKSVTSSNTLSHHWSSFVIIVHSGIMIDISQDTINAQLSTAISSVNTNGLNHFLLTYISSSSQYNHIYHSKSCASIVCVPRNGSTAYHTLSIPSITVNLCDLFISVSFEFGLYP